MLYVLDLLVLLCFLVGGIYASVTGVRMTYWRQLHYVRLFFPRGETPATCHAPRAYRRFLRLRLLILGALSLVTASTFFWGTYIPTCPHWISVLSVILAVISAGHYFFVLRYVAKRYFS